MAFKYSLSANEFVLFEIENAILYIEGRSRSARNGRLVLTNQRIIWLEFGLFGKLKKEQWHSFEEFQIYLGEPRIKVEDHFGGLYQATFYYQDSTETIVFPEKKAARELVKEIYKIFAFHFGQEKDQEKETHSGKKKYIPLPTTLGESVDLFANIVRTRLEDYESRQKQTTSKSNISAQSAKGDRQLGTMTQKARMILPPIKDIQSGNIKRNTDNRRIRTVMDCPHCGAPLSGIVGQIMTCEYCGCDTTIESMM